MSQFFLFDDETLNGKISLSKNVWNEYVPNNVLQNHLLLKEDNDITIDISQEDKAKVKIAGAISSLQNLNSANIAIMKTTFPTQDINIDWYKNIKNDYNIIKECSIDWNTSISSAITSYIPSSVIDFAPKYDFFAKDILSNIDSSSSQEEKKTRITKDVTFLLQESSKIANNFNAFSHIEDGKSVGTIPDWSKKILNACSSFQDISKDITDKNKYTEIEEKIKASKLISESLAKEIKSFNNLIITGGAFMGGGAFAAGAIGFPMLFINPMAAGITIFFGVGAFIAGSTLIGVYADKLSKITKKKAEIDAEINQYNKLLASLPSLETTSNILVNSYNLMSENITGFLNSWNTISNNLNSIISKLNEGEMYNQQDFLGAVKMSIESSLPLWNSVYEYSFQLQNSVTLEPKIINKDTIIQ